MRRIRLFLLVPFLCLISCQEKTETSNSENLLLEIPSKLNATDNAAMTSPINSRNLDLYLFRDDVQYVDLRNMDIVFEEGYVCGFQFIPFYQLVASFTSANTLYTMRRTESASAGQVGSFIANFEESEEQINYYFSKDLPIFFLSQGGSEAAYMINLLIQLGYDGKKLYNAGGIVNNEGIPAYRDIKTNKYYVKAGVSDVDSKFDFTFKDELTPVNNQ